MEIFKAATAQNSVQEILTLADESTQQTLR